MPNKPDKFGIKFWLLVDTKSKYLVNGFPYLCKDDERPESMQLPEYVVKRIMVESVLNKGYNVTCDNFFTSKNICDYLLKNKTSLLGTIRVNRRELPQNLKEIMQSCKLHNIMIASDTCILTAYKCKMKKFVALLSSLHEGVVLEGIKTNPIL